METLLLSYQMSMKTFTILKGILFGSVVILLAGCSQGKAADTALKDAQRRVLSADQIIVVTPTKDSWFNKNIIELPSGKEVAIKVKPESDQEFILVKSKDESAVILPITDGKCSVVTDKDTVAKYQAKVGGSSGSGKGASGTSSSSASSGDEKGASGTWKVKGKTITAGMSKEQVIKLLGNPVAETQEGWLEYEDTVGNSITSGAKASAFGLVPFGGYANEATRSSTPITSKHWSIHFSSGGVSNVLKTEFR